MLTQPKAPCSQPRGAAAITSTARSSLVAALQTPPNSWELRHASLLGKAFGVEVMIKAGRASAMML